MNRTLKTITTAMGILAIMIASVARADAPPKRLYARFCASCHGADGSGNPEMAAGTLQLPADKLNLGRAEAAGITRDQKREILLHGKGKMPAYDKKLAPDQVDPVLDYTLQLTDALRRK
jgi:mono/diheme cytochrome c family protein